METTTWVPKYGPDPIPVDFNWMPDQGVVGLNTRGTVEALSERGITLREGMALNVWDADADDDGNRNDLVVRGHIQRWQDIWVLRFDEPLHWQADEQHDSAAGD